ncbi:hypothetical protein [Lysinibacillus sphaericus]|uniref:Uncharacterized protein n=1 Tax=Lysinibacillus sphaericus OT4b.31 TaxID=1285586 RepID=R7ZF29_LYSSH|nr:hypothetical protein [Lysinibacillus sphaericus]EON72604.1 hypothetical protein H131_10703 [Lysinibacillus sphaericus OT4b.31]
MQYDDLMQWEGYFFLHKIFEPHTNSLRVQLKRAKISAHSTDVIIGDNILDHCQPIEIDESLPIIQIDFDSYVSYSVFDESFYGTEDNFKGNAIRIYEKSRYLNFVMQQTIANVIYPDKEFIHYGVSCLDHIIEIVSYDVPIVSQVAN